MTTTLVDHPGRVVKASQLDGAVVKEKPADRFVLVALRGRQGVVADDLEKSAWHYGATAPKATGIGVCAVESWIYRNPADWTVSTPKGTVVVKSGSWLAGFVLSEPAWKQYQRGELGPKALLELARSEPDERKEAPVGYKKQVRKLQKSLNGGAAASRPTVNALYRRVGVPGGNPFAPFDERVARAERELEKAKLTDDPYARDIAKRELRQATYQRTAMKMIAAEHARERDPQAVARSMRGQGVPLFTNRHALGDDPMVSGV